MKSAGVSSLAAAVTTAADAEAQTGPRVVGPGDVPVTLTVNGKRVELRIEPRVTLLDALRSAPTSPATSASAIAAPAAPAR